MLNTYSIYKLSRKYYLNGNIFLAKLLMKINRLRTNSYIPYTAEIGENTEFAYGGIGIVLHKNTVIGNNCMIGQGITIGGRTGHGGPPIIGNNVYISAGARLIGSFKVGDNSIIGANAVVISDVPPNAVVAGVPAKIIKYNNEDKQFSKAK